MSDMSDYDNEHYDPMYGYDDDGDDYLDMYDDDDGEPSEYIDGYWYGEDDTIELTVKGKLELLRMRIAYRWRTFWELRSSRLKYRIHKLRMRYDTHYATHYWDDIPF